MSQGSMRAVPRPHGGVWMQANPKLAPWRRLVAAAARKAARQSYADNGGPVIVELSFFLKAPQRLFRLTDVAVEPHTKKPDVDKLARAILDAMTGVLYADDSQVISLTVGKWYSRDPRVEVAVALLDPDCQVQKKAQKKTRTVRHKKKHKIKPRRGFGKNAKQDLRHGV